MKHLLRCHTILAVTIKRHVHNPSAPLHCWKRELCLNRFRRVVATLNRVGRVNKVRKIMSVNIKPLLNMALRIKIYVKKWPITIDRWYFVWSRWLDIGQVVVFSCFFVWHFYEPRRSQGLKARNKVSQYPAILTRQVWSIEDLLYGIENKYFLRGTACKIASEQESTISTTLVTNHGTEFDLSCPLKIYWIITNSSLQLCNVY